MARIRTIKPEAFTSRETSAMSDAVFRTFTGLFCYVDDKGRGEDDADLIKADIAPQIKAKTPKVIAAHLAELAAGGDAPLCRNNDGMTWLPRTRHPATAAKEKAMRRPKKSDPWGDILTDPEAAAAWRAEQEARRAEADARPKPPDYYYDIGPGSRFD